MIQGTGGQTGGQVNGGGGRIDNHPVIVINPMGMKRITQFVLAGVMAWTMHLDLPVLQVVAWGGMLVRYSREAPLREAVTKTFDGEHPCALCLTIRDEVQEIPRNQLRATPPPEVSLVAETLDGAVEFDFAWIGVHKLNPTIRPGGDRGEVLP